MRYSQTKICFDYDGVRSIITPKGKGSLRYWAYLIRAFLQALAFEPGRVPVPAPMWGGRDIASSQFRAVFKGKSVRANWALGYL